MTGLPSDSGKPNALALTDGHNLQMINLFGLLLDDGLEHPFREIGTMVKQEARASLGGPHGEVFTLAEAASYLRVTDDALRELAEQKAIPARRIAGEWRFLKRALGDWLGNGCHDFRDFYQSTLPWMFEFLQMEEWLTLLEKRLLAKLSRAEEKTPKPGTKEAVLKHFGIFKDDEDLEAQLAEMRAQREEG